MILKWKECRHGYNGWLSFSETAVYVYFAIYFFLTSKSRRTSAGWLDKRDKRCLFNWCSLLLENASLCLEACVSAMYCLEQLLSALVQIINATHSDIDVSIPPAHRAHLRWLLWVQVCVVLNLISWSRMREMQLYMRAAEMKFFFLSRLWRIYYIRHSCLRTAMIACIEVVYLLGVTGVYACVCKERMEKWESRLV